jgi:hypothetical protein
VSTTADYPTAAHPVIPLSQGPGAPRRRRRIVAAVVLVIVAVAGVLVVADPFGGQNTGSGGVTDNADPTSIATVSHGAISEQTQLSATLGYSGSYTVINQGQGTITSLPSVGQVVSDGQVLYEINGSPVVLLYGTTPAYRTLSEGSTDSATSGPDVQNLNVDLVALGYLSSSDIAADPADFTAATKAGVEALQAALGVTQNGVLSLGQFVFLPTAARVTGYSGNTVSGGLAQPGSPILTATSTGRLVTIDLDADQQGEVTQGDKVTITLPNGQTTLGTVTSVGTVASSSSASGNSSPTVPVLVTPDDPSATGTLDQASVEVTITNTTVNDAFIVPVASLLALADGGYALEVVTPRGNHVLEPVSLGIFDDGNGTVQVIGSDISAGQRIVVPGT